jgi:hypothetical protein
MLDHNIGSPEVNDHILGRSPGNLASARGEDQGQ